MSGPVRENGGLADPCSHGFHGQDKVSEWGEGRAVPRWTLAIIVHDLALSSMGSLSRGLVALRDLRRGDVAYFRVFLAGDCLFA